MSPRLRPGLVVVRRDDRHLQVGFAPPRRVVLSDLPQVRRLLDDLRQGHPLGRLSPAAAAALSRLEAADLLAPPPPARLPSVALTGPRSLTDAATAQLRSAGLRIGEWGGADAADGSGEAGGPGRGSSETTMSDAVGLLLAHGALARELADPLVRDGIPHLIAVATPWGWDLGPFVVPGQTACLRCVDAAHRDSDPRHGVVLDQLTRASVSGTVAGPAAGTPAALRPPLLGMALGWVARDLLAYARGERPTTWSTTVHLAETPGEELIGERRWLRHPHCGCAWDALTG